MEVIGQFFATICSTIFGTFFMVWIIAAAFDHMAGNKNMNLSRGVLSFSMKVLGEIGKGLIFVSVPLVRSVGEKIVYVAGHYIEKNKQKPAIPEFQDIQNTDTSTTTPTNDGPGGNQGQGQNKKAAANSYDAPADPEIIE